MLWQLLSRRLNRRRLRQRRRRRHASNFSVFLAYLFYFYSSSSFSPWFLWFQNEYLNFRPSDSKDRSSLSHKYGHNNGLAMEICLASLKEKTGIPSFSMLLCCCFFFPLASRSKSPDNASQCQNTTQIQSWNSNFPSKNEKNGLSTWIGIRLENIPARPRSGSNKKIHSNIHRFSLTTQERERKNHHFRKRLWPMNMRMNVQVQRRTIWNAVDKNAQKQRREERESEN